MQVGEVEVVQYVRIRTRLSLCSFWLDRPSERRTELPPQQTTTSATSAGGHEAKPSASSNCQAVPANTEGLAHSYVATSSAGTGALSVTSNVLVIPPTKTPEEVNVLAAPAMPTRPLAPAQSAAPRATSKKPENEVTPTLPIVPPPSPTVLTLRRPTF